LGCWRVDDGHIVVLDAGGAHALSGHRGAVAAAPSGQDGGRLVALADDPAIALWPRRVPHDEAGVCAWLAMLVRSPAAR